MSTAYVNEVSKAARIREKDEQLMQNFLQSLQYKYQIYNDDIEPEHDVDWYCGCDIHQYVNRKWQRVPTLKMWSKAVMYPGEKFYHDCHRKAELFTGNPYFNSVGSPYNLSPYGDPPLRYNMDPYSEEGQFLRPTTVRRPNINAYNQHLASLNYLNATLNAKSQANIDKQEPAFDIWSSIVNGDKDAKIDVANEAPSKTSKRSRLSTLLGLKPAAPSPEFLQNLVTEIQREEAGRWSDDAIRDIVAGYQAKTGISERVAYLRQKSPIQYLHLLRAGYFEPIPVAWADQMSNPLKFKIDAEGGWRGITPQWRGYEDTAEERLYWVLNHRKGISGQVMKPDQQSVLRLAQERMGSAVDPPPQYFADDDVCRKDPNFHGYSKQVKPKPFHPFDRPESALDDTMILLDVSGSMAFQPFRPVYDGCLIISNEVSQQPKNKDTAKAIIRRFTAAMENRDSSFDGYDVVTFSDKAAFVGTINNENFDEIYDRVRFGGGTRVMTGWQKVKQRHFQKHSESAINHPVFGWQAGPETPILRLLLLLDGEATDMDEFELDLLSLTWAHVTIFLVGVDGCPHHHRHANELQRISDNNHHVSFVDAQGNSAERYVTHELLKRHLGEDLSMEQFEKLETPPPYSEIVERAT